MKYLKLVLLIPFIISFSGCVSKKAVLATLPEGSNILLAGNPTKIEIVDKRIGITEKQIRIPIMTLPGQRDKVSPVLTDCHRKQIEDQIMQHFNHSNPELKINCIIIEGFQEFTAHAFHEREYVQFDVKIELLDLRDNVIRYCTSSAFFEIKSIDASNKFINKLYEKAIQTSINRCFLKLDN